LAHRDKCLIGIKRQLHSLLRYGEYKNNVIIISVVAVGVIIIIIITKQSGVL
jgi:hypothetical protein